jgi:GR25 family glycosyltransferase involved in LPS biosynthesis
MQHIDAILYINLVHRTDRNEHMLVELKKLCNDSSKIHRIDAIKHDRGAIGCGLSHIKALQYAQSHPEWNSVLILEDDFTCKPDMNHDTLITLLYETAPTFDVGLLTTNPAELKYENTVHESIKKVLFSQTASAYIIKQYYIPNLIENMMNAVQSMQIYGIKHENCIDIHWGVLQSKDNWYCIYPAIGYQYASYSDIQNTNTNYGC